jgi:hypothetical protein
MRTIFYDKKHNPESCFKLNLKLVKRAGNMNIMPGDRVLVGESLLFKNDIDTPWDSLLRPGTVTNRFGILAYTYDSPELESTIFGPYPDYLEIEMDEIRPTGDKKTGSFTYAVRRIL